MGFSQFTQFIWWFLTIFKERRAGWFGFGFVDEDYSPFAFAPLFYTQSCIARTSSVVGVGKIVAGDSNICYR